MTRLSQIIAVKKDAQNRAEQTAAFAYHELQKPEPLTGITKTYEPRADDGERLPPEENRVQYTVELALRQASAKTARYMDLLGTQEATDQIAVADVIVDDKVFLAKVPVLLLLGLERLLGEELVQARKLPTLSPKHEWDPYDNRGVFVSKPIMTTRSKKIRKYNVMTPANEKFPAQIDPVDEDTVVGDWETRHYSGAIPVGRKQDILDRLVKLIMAVQQAREEANTTQVTDFKVGNKIFGYLYGIDDAGK